MTNVYRTTPIDRIKIRERANISTPDALGILFVALKLCGVIEWPWVWVVAPFWAVPAVLIACIVGLWAAAIVVYSWRQLKAKRRRWEAQ